MNNCSLMNENTPCRCAKESNSGLNLRELSEYGIMPG